MGVYTRYRFANHFPCQNQLHYVTNKQNDESKVSQFRLQWIIGKTLQAISVRMQTKYIHKLLMGKRVKFLQNVRKGKRDVRFNVEARQDLSIQIFFST